MSNFISSGFSLGTAFLGIGQMENRDFEPVVYAVYIVGLIVLCVLAGVLGEELERKFIKLHKRKWDGTG